MSSLALQTMAAKRKNQRGMASIEVLPILVVFLMLIGYALGFFGIVHSAILQSIGSRAYAVETFRNRSNLEIFRDKPTPSTEIYYGKLGNRAHAIGSDADIGLNDNRPTASKRALSFGRVPAQLEGNPARSEDFHNNTVLDMGEIVRLEGQENNVDPVWIMVSYGICIDAGCGDN